MDIKLSFQKTKRCKIIDTLYIGNDDSSPVFLLA